MKKVLLSIFAVIALSIPVNAAYNASDRVQTVGEALLTKNGISIQNVKFTVVSGDVNNSEFGTNRVVNISSADLAYTGNDNEVAAVVANELGHIISGHASKGKIVSLITSGAETNNNSTASTLAQNYQSSKEEKEADVIAVNLMANSGYNPLAIIVVLTKQTGTYWETLQGKPANADRAMNVYDYTGYAYPAKLKAGYACNEYKNFVSYANTVITDRNSNKKTQAKLDKELQKYRKNSVSQITKFKTRGGLSGWDAAYGLLNAQ
ncbi:M48 family metalloprotease [bacterium]|nr:M48 family metalloprotease [bacterium]